MDAIWLCDQDVVYHYKVSGSGSIDDANGANSLFCQNQTSAEGFESDSAWFKFTVQQSGEFGFVIQPDTAEDFEFILFGPNPDCNDLTNTAYWLSCDSQQTPPIAGTGNESTGIGAHPIYGGNGSAVGFQPYINVAAGDTYYLFVTPFVTTGKSFKLWLQGDVFTAHDSVLYNANCILNTSELTTEKISVYPNPIDEQLHIQSKVPFNQMVLYDTIGQELARQIYSSTFDMSTYQNGLYFLKFIDKQGRYAIVKVMKE
jgi:hypothetical protein